MTLSDALESYTAAGAYASFEEDIKGKIQPGMLADFTVWSADPFETRLEKLSQITAREVYLGGRCVYMSE